jgi:tetratricopeptide (TPR) repeat protein
LFLLILLFSGMVTQAQDANKLADLGGHYYRTREYDSCVYCYARANRLDPKNPWNLVNKGVCEIRLDKYVEALDDLNRALELDTDNEIAYYDIACVYSLEKDARKAIIICNSHYLNQQIGNTVKG